MNYIIESILVGLYSVVIFLFFSPFVGSDHKKFYLTLVAVGFLKHLMGSFLGIHTWYCNNGDACIKKLPQNHRYIAKTTNLLRDSIFEAFAYLCLGFILRGLFKNDLMGLFFTIGFILHLLSELLLIHNSFCNTYCVKEYK